MIRKVELYVKNVICGKRKGLIPTLLKLTLLPVSWIYREIVAIRNWLYDKGWMRRYIPPVALVMSIGNIVAGGTGKTPVTLLLANAFYTRFSIAILSRGYRSKAEKLDHPIVLCEGNGPMYSAAYCGDEPYIFAQRLPKAHVIVGGDRYKASHIAAQAGVQMILLDDGMQHRRLARDYEIIVVDVGDPFGHDYFIPRGFLREDKRSLSRAHLIILNHVTGQEHFEQAKVRMSPYTIAPMIGTNWQVEQACDLKGNSVGPLQGLKVGLFCGIAHPEYFKQTLEKEGVIVVGEHHLADHEKPNLKKLEAFAKECAIKEATWLLCTEKDQVKLETQLSLKLPVAWLKMELKVVEGKEIWQDFLTKVESKIY